MKEEKKTSMSEERVVDLLTPRHAPECKASFRAPQTPHRIKAWRYIRTAGMAAVLMIGIFVGIKVLTPGKAYAAMTPQLVIDKAREKLRDVRSFRMELSFTPEWNDKTADVDGKVTYYILRTDRGDITRTETYESKYDHATVFLYTPDSTKIWSDGKLEYALHATKSNQHQSLTLDMLMERIENDKDRLSLKEEGDEVTLRLMHHAYKYQYYYEVAFSKTDGLIKSFNGYVTDNDGFLTHIECRRIDYNIPLTAEEIQRAP